MRPGSTTVAALIGIFKRCVCWICAGNVLVVRTVWSSQSETKCHRARAALARAPLGSHGAARAYCSETRRNNPRELINNQLFQLTVVSGKSLDGSSDGAAVALAGAHLCHQGAVLFGCQQQVDATRPGHGLALPVGA